MTYGFDEMRNLVEVPSKAEYDTATGALQQAITSIKEECFTGANYLENTSIPHVLGTETLEQLRNETAGALLAIRTILSNIGNQ